MKFPLSLASILGVSLACAAPHDPPAAPENAAAFAPSATQDEPVHPPGGGGRPVELDYKDQREQDALLGLSYGVGERGRVSVDQAQAARVLAGADLSRAADEAAQDYARGLALYARNARLEAISAHTRAVLLDPSNASMYEGLGDALRAERFESRAEAAYRTGLDLEPTAGLHVRLAEILWMRSQREAAISQALEAIALAPDDARANADLARWYYFTNDYAEAWTYVHHCEQLGVALRRGLGTRKIGLEYGDSHGSTSLYLSRS